MHLWEMASLVFFIYTATIAAGATRLTGRWRALGGSLVGLLLSGTAALWHSTPLMHDWLLPLVVLPVAYWTSGALWTGPMPGAERLLMRFDCTLRVRRISSRMPQALSEVLELAYVGVYPLVPIALALHIVFVPAPDVDRFWSVVLITDYICFGMLPWVQTRTPRVLEQQAPWTASIRRFNLRLLGVTSIHVNTFPSGHTAEALAAALLVVGAPLPIVLSMFFIALAISAGAVFGRYHYAADALSGWAAALAVWLLL